mmetsp:Transcript_23254/g.41999  ORF Transcript_23254/g.41999 Transcript_23254/m.41999 type:complete len:373 (+) Transcript_23254:45-1163(+)
MSEASLDALSALVECNIVSPAETQELRSCVHSIQMLVKNLGPAWQVRPFGSSANGFCMKGADLDVTCFKKNAENGLEALHELKTKLVPLLQQDPRFELKEAIWQARVPILKLKFADLDVDLSCQNTEAILNTELLKAYAKLHPKIRKLVIAVKIWAKSAGVNGAPRRHLSSYSWTLMVLYFLQVQQDLQLPCLPTAAFNLNSSPSFDNIQWSCRMSLPQLLDRFFSFFTYEFQWGSEVVSVRLGKRAEIRSQEFKQLPGQAVWRLHVEDPFLLNRNLNCVLGSQQESELQAAINSASWEMSAGQVPESLRGQLMLNFLTSKSSPASASTVSTNAGSFDGEEVYALSQAAPDPQHLPKTKLAAFAPNNHFLSS